VPQGCGHARLADQPAAAQRRSLPRARFGPLGAQAARLGNGPDRVAHQTYRDDTFVQKLPNGTTVNHTLGIGSLGGATLDNEENYLVKKLFGGGLGLVWIENQARICHSASVPSLGSTYGRGAATLPQWDLANSDCVVVMGSNMAENHPIAFRFVLKAKEKGATVIHVDPPFTRTSALADIYAPIRTGTDIAFLGGIIRYLLENDLWFTEYALNFTNIATIIDERFLDADQLDGLFSGWDDAKHVYQYDSWQYQGEAVPSSLADHPVNTTESFSEKTKRMQKGPPPRDLSLQHPNCVNRIMRRHYARYTPEMVESITGCPKEIFIKIAEELARNSGRERTGAFCYAVAWTHHTTVGYRSSAQPRSSRLCSVIRAAPVAASWRCAVTAAFRAAPMCRRSIICCRPICRSRRRIRPMGLSLSISRTKQPRPAGGTTSGNMR
jgi:formate dehydrogenase major subunit